MRTALLVVVFSSALVAQSPPNQSFRSPQRPMHATVAASPADLDVTPGAKAELFIEVTPRENIHVYAPGAKDFIPITVKVDPQSGVKVGKLIYPKSEMMTFADEKVPVFQKPFRLTQELTVLGMIHPGAVAVKATVAYQACDDKVCYAPESAPIGWTLNVK